MPHSPAVVGIALLLSARGSTACTPYGSNRYCPTYDVSTQSCSAAEPCCSGLVECVEPDPNSDTGETRTVCLASGCHWPPPPSPPPPSAPSPPSPPCNAYGNNRYHPSTEPCCPGLVECEEPDPWGDPGDTRTMCLAASCKWPPSPPPPSTPPTTPPPSPPAPAATLVWSVPGLELRLEAFAESDCGTSLPSLVATPSSPTVTLPLVECSAWGGWTSWRIVSVGTNEYYGHLALNQLRDNQEITTHDYGAPHQQLYCVSPLANATDALTGREITFTGAAQAPCGCAAQPSVGTTPLSPECFVPSDRNWDAGAQAPHTFAMDRTLWRGDTGHGLWSSDGYTLTQDLTQALTGTEEYEGGRVYLAEGDGLGALYGQWQIDVRLGNNYGNTDRFCEAFVLSGRDAYGHYADGQGSTYQDGPSRGATHNLPELDVVETFWSCKGADQ